MSIICHLVLFLLCLCFCACNARQLGVIDREVAERFHLPNQDNEKSSPVRVLDPSNPQQSMSSKFDAARKENIDKEIKVHEHHHKKTAKKPVGRAQLKGHGVKSSGASQTESSVFVSWKVPHKKKGEQQPGFNLDYSPPKTHPPVHN